MANDEHVAMLKKGVAAWNAWRRENRDIRPDLSEANLRKANFREADLTRANLTGAHLSKTRLTGANLNRARLSGANLSEADLSRADLSRANLGGANLIEATLVRADLSKANLSRANLIATLLFEANLDEANLCDANLSRAKLARANLGGANLSEANLSGASLIAANLFEANLRAANLGGADLKGAILSEANLSGANLSEADLQSAILLDTDLTGADLTGCRVYGVSAWGLKLEGAKQHNLVITRHNEPEITVDNIEVAQFVYLLLHNEKIRDVIDTIGKKGVLLLGRFTEGRIMVLERLRERLRDLGFVPMVFNFDKPETKDFTETVRLLASLSKFVIVDITNPRSAPLELQATVPDYMVPFAPILQQGEQPFSMFVDLQNK
jgi:uncharacterized protein YjbI with pentapeptide repeats